MTASMSPRWRSRRGHQRNRSHSGCATSRTSPCAIRACRTEPAPPPGRDSEADGLPTPPRVLPCLPAIQRNATVSLMDRLPLTAGVRHRRWLVHNVAGGAWFVRRAAPGAPAPSGLGHDGGALANSGGDPLGRSRANVADRENTRQPGFEGNAGRWIGLTSSPKPLPVTTKPLGSVSTHPSSQPVFGSAPMNRKGGATGRRGWSRCAAGGSPRRSAPFTGRLPARRLRRVVKVDIRQRRDALDEIARHARLDLSRARACAGASPCRRGTRPPGRRSCRRRPAPPPRPAELGLDRRGPVGDARALEVEVRDVRPAIARARRETTVAPARRVRRQAQPRRRACRGSPPAIEPAT